MKYLRTECVMFVKDKQGEAYSFMCQACEMTHLIPTSYRDGYELHNGRPKRTWAFNGNLEKPSFKPDFKIVWSGDEPPQVCHFIIRDGWIIYLTESTHALTGKRVQMEVV